MASRRGGIGDALKASLAQQRQDVAVEVMSTIEAPASRPSVAATVHEIPHGAIAPNVANPRKDMGDLDVGG